MSSIKSLKKMILMFENKIINQIETGKFNVGVIIEHLNKINPADKWQKDSVKRIVEAVINQGYTVNFDGKRYYIYK